MFQELVKTADVRRREPGPGRDGAPRASATRRLAAAEPAPHPASVKGFGGGGPYADYKSFEWIAQAMGGAMSMTGSPDGPPTKAIGGLADTGAGLHTAIGILAAIIQRQATGVGQQVEVAQQDAVVNLLRIHLRETLRQRQAGPAPGQPLGGRRAVQHLPLPGRSGPTTTSSSTAPPRTCGRRSPGSSAGPSWATTRATHDRRDRVQFVDEIDAHDRGVDRDAHQARGAWRSWPAPACRAARCSTRPRCCPTRTCASAASSPTSSIRAAGAYPMPGNPVRLSDSPTEVTRAPLLGEHNAEVYGRLLGYKPEDIDQLKRDGVI